MSSSPPTSSSIYVVVAAIVVISSSPPSSSSANSRSIPGSLLEVAKLNGRGGVNVTIFLGSSQSDPAAGERVLSGGYPLVYVTPKKSTGNGDETFLKRLANMHSGGGRGRICLVAVDKSHCVSEWGHVPPDWASLARQFRPEVDTYNGPEDRCQGEAGNSIASAFEGIAAELALAIVVRRGTVGGGGGSAKAAGMGKSTIVYCSTKREVDDVAARIAQPLAHQLVCLMQQQPTDGASLDQSSELASAHVRAYHTGLSHSQRTDGHAGFLIGKVSIIMARVAFTGYKKSRALECAEDRGGVLPAGGEGRARRLALQVHHLCQIRRLC